MESINIKMVYGLAKVVGSVASLLGALTFAFLKGPPIKFLNWSPSNNNQSHTIRTSPNFHDQAWEWIKGPLMMLSANIVWSFWLILQVCCFSYTYSIMHLRYYNLYLCLIKKEKPLHICVYISSNY